MDAVHARLNNEFALVHVEVDRRPNGQRLRITSTRTGRSRTLDPLMLEVLTWLPLEHFLDALETPFGPEPDLGVVMPPGETSYPTEIEHGAPEADAG